MCEARKIVSCYLIERVSGDAKFENMKLNFHNGVLRRCIEEVCLLLVSNRGLGQTLSGIELHHTNIHQ